MQHQQATEVNITVHNYELKQTELLLCQQSSPLSNENQIVSVILQETREDNNSGTQVQNLDVIIPLDDCMKCVVKIPRCQVNTHVR